MILIGFENRKLENPKMQNRKMKIINLPLDPADVFRFREHYLPGPQNLCWEWFVNREYPMIRCRGIAIYAHRFAYALFYGQINDELLVLHTCDNTRCVNPYHLFQGSDLDNALDRDTKSRDASYGEHNPSAILTSDRVQYARVLLQAGISQASVAKELGVSTQCISDIATGVKWKSV